MDPPGKVHDHFIIYPGGIYLGSLNYFSLFPLPVLPGDKFTRFICPRCQGSAAIGSRSANPGTTLIQDLSLAAPFHPDLFVDSFLDQFFSCPCGFIAIAGATAHATPFFELPFALHSTIAPALYDEINALFARFGSSSAAPQGQSSLTPRDERILELFLEILQWRARISRQAAYQQFLEEIRTRATGPSKAGTLKIFARYFIHSDEFNGFFSRLFLKFRERLHKTIKNSPDPTPFHKELQTRATDELPPDLIFRNYFIYIYIHLNDDQDNEIPKDPIPQLESNCQNARLRLFQAIHDLHKSGFQGASGADIPVRWENLKRAWNDFLQEKLALLNQQLLLETREKLLTRGGTRRKGEGSLPHLDPDHYPFVREAIAWITNGLKKFILEECITFFLDRHIEQERLALNLSERFDSISPKGHQALQGQDIFHSQLGPIFSAGSIEHQILHLLGDLATRSVNGPESHLEAIVRKILTLLHSRLHGFLDQRDPQGTLLLKRGIAALEIVEREVKNRALDKLMRQTSPRGELDFEYGKFSRWVGGHPYLQSTPLRGNSSMLNNFHAWGYLHFFFNYYGLYESEPYAGFLKSMMTRRREIEHHARQNDLFEGQGEAFLHLIVEVERYLRLCQPFIAAETSPLLRGLLEFALYYAPLERLTVDFGATLFDPLPPPPEPHGGKEETVNTDYQHRLLLAGYLFLRQREYGKARQAYKIVGDRLSQKSREGGNPHIVLTLIQEMTRGFTALPALYIHLPPREIEEHTARLLQDGYRPNTRYD